MASSESNPPEETGPDAHGDSQAGQSDPLDSGIANSTSDKEDQMDREPSDGEWKGVLTSQGTQSRPQSRSQEFRYLDEHLNWIRVYIDKVETGIMKFQASNGAMDITKLNEEIDKFLSEVAALKNNINRLQMPSNNFNPPDKVVRSSINPRPETQPAFPQNSHNAAHPSQQGDTRLKQPYSQLSSSSNDSSSAMNPQAATLSTSKQETELGPLQRKLVTNLMPFNTSPPQHNSPDVSTPQNRQHVATHHSTNMPTARETIRPLPTGAPTYQDINRYYENMSTDAEEQGMYTDGPSAARAVAVEATSGGQPNPTGNQATQPRPSTSTSSSFLGSTSISQSPFHDWTLNSQWGKVFVWDIKNTRYNKGTSFKQAQQLYYFSRSVGAIMKNDHLWGTCARYGQRHVMTCQHVASPDYANLDDPSNSFVEFNYYNDWPPRPSIRFPIQRIDYNNLNSKLDFCLLLLNIQDSELQEVQNIIPGLGPYVQQGILPVEVERVTLIGHPQGDRTSPALDPKTFDYNCPVLDWYQSAEYTDQISDIKDSLVFQANRINYRSTFWHGSSGSPVVATYEDNLQIVAMHTQGYPTGGPCEVEQGVTMSAIWDELENSNRPDLCYELFT